MAAAAALSLGIKIGQESTLLRSGDINRDEFRKRTGRHVGAVTGTLAGAGIGTVIGRLWPGGGTVIGAFMGGMLGEMWGERVGRLAVDRFSWRKTETEPTASPDNDETDIEPVTESDPGPPRRDL